MPWKELQSGPSPVDRTLFLDYVSPLLPVSLWMSIKHRHWPVTLAIFGKIFILGAIVFSPGLLRLVPTDITTQRSDLALKSELRVADDYDPETAWMTGPAPAQLYYGIQFQGLQYPPGTSGDYVVPNLQAPQSTNANFSATTEGVHIGYDCELLPWKNATETYMPWRSILGSFFVADVDLPDCKIKGVTVAASPDHGFYKQPNATQNYQAQFDVYPCNVDFDFGGQPFNNSNKEERDMIYDVAADQRIVMSVADLRFPPRDPGKTQPDYFYINQLTAAICKGSYSIDNFDVRTSDSTNGMAQAVLSGPIQAEPQSAQSDRQLPGMHNGTLSLGVFGAVYHLFLGTGGDDYVLSETVPTFFQLMGLKNGNSTMKAFMDPGLMIDTGTHVFKGVAAQLLHQLAFQPVSRNVTGYITSVENRLKVTKLSTSFMSVFLGLLALLSITMIFIRPHSVVPHRPGSLASTAAILASSESFHNTLIHTETSKLSHVRRRLGNFQFRTVILPDAPSSFAIEPIMQTKGESFNEPSEDNHVISWWRPIASTSWFLTLAILFPLILIAVLEVLQHDSDRNNGIVSLQPNSALVLATYIPAAVGLAIGGMYAGIEDITALFAPYNALIRGGASADRSINLNLVGPLLPYAAYLSIKSRHFAATVALLGSFIGSFLTIIVSGLYSARTVVQVDPVTVQQTDAFDFRGVDLSLGDNQASAVDSLITYLDLKDTKWTHGDLVYNHFDEPTVVITDSDMDAPLNAEVPALRAKLNCTVVPMDDRDITFANLEDMDGMGSFPGLNGFYESIPGRFLAGFNTTFRYNDWCETSPTSNHTHGTWMQYFSLPRTNTSIYIGKASPMLWESDTGIIYGDGSIDTDPRSGTGVGSSGIPPSTHGCPTFAVTLGNITVDQKRQGNRTALQFEYNLGTVMCYQNIEQVSTNVTWQLPDFGLDPRHPPRPDESSVKLLKTPGGSERHEFVVNAWLGEMSDAVYNRTIPGPNGAPAYMNDIDQFIKAMVFGKKGHSLDTLVGEENALNLANAANDLYTGYMAQAISLNMRAGANSDGSALPSYQGRLQTATRQRLQQNAGPKIALQVLLGVMVLGAIATRLMSKVHQVLPHNPCSIAGSATMLAGSRLVSRDVIPVGAEWKKDGELRREGVFEGQTYSLKWWKIDNGPQGRERYGIDVDKGSL
ncbi:hypothetical protein B0I35DRAFT_102489 [Stachybotrys elegans]|uniref:Uncharacterized protein n=1 Tax=Stachybotrys elegans TaxID=80388 RepID=A0A8K0WKS3_9HYPO|nr:hypothetical protein B0I35DRAFT_102489 [Stachybotrys elegans]